MEMPEMDGKLTLRKRVLDFVESSPVQTFLTVLLILDIIVVIADVALDSEYPSCDAALRVCGLHGPHECADAPNYVTQFKTVSSIMSTSILFIFLLEIILTAYGIGFIEYLKTYSYIFDTVIVVSSLVLELVEGKSRHDTGLLVLARAWRFITLVHDMGSARKERERRFGRIEQTMDDSYRELVTE